MKIEVLADADAVARAGAEFTAGQARAAVTARGRFIMAVSGGHTPRTMLRALADQDLPWNEVHVVQVDERVAPAGHPDRNLTHLRESLLAHSPLRPEQLHATPVEAADLEAASAEYAATLRQIAGTPPVLDLAHLGLGPDGHTASLVPGDAVLDVTDADVALTGLYQGRRRMTLTYPILDRARRIVWLITGREKAEMLARLRDGDRSIPAGRIRQHEPFVVADYQAGGPEMAPAVFPWKTSWTPQFRVTVDIVHFDGPLSGPAVLAARWRLLGECGKVLALHAVTLQAPVTAPTHAGLVAAQGRLLTTLSRDIATGIRRRQR
jgi:6-phosphogluconolactonase